MKKILYVSGTRADYGLMRKALFRIGSHPKLRIEIAVTGMHLMPEFGMTINEIKKDKFKIHELKVIYRGDSKESMANFIGELILRLNKAIKEIKPDIILVLGDRAEMLAAAIAGAYLAIPVVHIHGGDVTSTVDEIVRHAITKLSHVHLAATSANAQRLRKMGEDSWRVHVVGAPGVEGIAGVDLLSKEKTARKYNLDLNRPVLLVVQHPVTAEIKEAACQMKETMEAIRQLGFQSIVVYPNADAGARRMIKVIEAYKKYPFIRAYRSLPRKDYLSIMRIASAIIGNSSSAIIEAPSLGLKAVNIGTRQQGRERAGNVIDVDYDKKQIKRVIGKIITEAAPKEKVLQYRSPYGNVKTAERITKILAGLKINNKLLEKKIYY